MELYVNKVFILSGFLYYTHAEPTCTTVEMCRQGVGEVGRQGPSSWFKGMTWEWGRAVATPSLILTLLLPQLVPMCACSGEGSSSVPLL